MAIYLLKLPGRIGRLVFPSKITPTIMLVTIDVPDQVAERFRLDDPAQSRRLLEAFLLRQHASGELSAGQVGRALGLGFHETAQFLFDHGAPPDVTPEENARDVETLEEFLLSKGK